ncbi:MAG TPA: ABC transporter ATP-binding protein, partial [Achromobacter sp.]|nr:ABC transporter ATP-binding protein [Achromobacter sp.]
PGRTAPHTDLPTIAGAVPSLDTAIRGCAFRDRCPVAEPRCAQPIAPRVQGEHRCLCVKPGALRAGALA